ncbi:hypothetical protein SAMN05216600_101375 [Pseudomonas cuatrocienegasensis]|uniref:Lipoprotein n=1 Tax=Pseudomonas cuatrocienegasensis TaxID=543360 RepID=A0ABY1B1Q0_9PSED|nr:MULTISPECIES: DUF799 domain-containing protein [Pseudomonas]OEC36465.1 hypothetical protein A7D25_04755 [Pseudomonas sp. 21C1]SEP70736.1 hypothetical protein SAMN05216600_101375 [Pseudomonas cuatrocienegasensis]
MTFPHSFRTLAALVLVVLLAGCATQQPYDYSAFKESNPASILVLPPVNKSPDVKASYSVYSHITLPLSEAGYYVLPVAVVDETFKQNGLMNAEEIRDVSPNKLYEIFAADTVLYIDVTEYGSSYKIISSEVAVTATATLVDLRSGKELWKGVARASSAEQQQNSGGGLAGILVTALVNQVINTLSDRGHEIAGIASQRLLTSNPVNGILPGPRARPISAR